MANQFSRTELLYGREKMNRLYNARIAVFGVGGVGGYTIEALVRSGVGEIDIIDSDQVAFSNLNRQIIATHDTIGRDKVDVMEERIYQINPDCIVHKHKMFYLPETKDHFDFTQYDYVVDAIDTVAGKIGIIVQAKEADVPVISSMGAGNKLHPELFEIADIHKTSVCPLAKVMRRELKKRGIKKCKVVYSKELPLKPIPPEGETAESKGTAGRMAPGSSAFVPSTVGLIIASAVINDLTEVNA